MKRFSLLALSLLLFILFLPISAIVLSLAVSCGLIARLCKCPNLFNYGFYLAFAYDQFANTAIFLGSPEETISSRLGRAIQSGSPIWWVPSLAWIVDTLARVIFNDVDHVHKSIEYSENIEKELVSWIK